MILICTQNPGHISHSGVFYCSHGTLCPTIIFSIIFKFSSECSISLDVYKRQIYYIINIAFGMVNRKILLAVMGVEYQGINGLFSNVLSLLSLAEMGIGTAIIYHLYKPIQEDDIFQIKTLMGFYRKCYNIIAIVVFSLGLLVLPFLDFFIGENSLDINFNIVYLLMLFEVLASYLFTYKRSILYAKQRNYIVFVADTFYLLLAYSIPVSYTHLYCCQYGRTS